MMPPLIVKVLSLAVCFCLVLEQSGFCQLPGPLDISRQLPRLSSGILPGMFRPLHLRSLSFEKNRGNASLLIDKGDGKNLSPEDLKSATKTLLRYFLIGITLPNGSFWVNLRPDSRENIITSELAETDVGRIFLEADVQLKKDTAGLTSPRTPGGKEYWDRLYKKAEELFGDENISIPTLTRPWIVPGEIIISETGNSAYIYKATLRVMLEEDYLKGQTAYKSDDPRLKVLNTYSSQLIRELIIPKLTREVNTAQRYASLRQVYYSLILSQWFKSRFNGKDISYSSLINRKDIAGLVSERRWSTDDYFNAYQKSFRNGEYDIQQSRPAARGQKIFSCFSGGIVVDIPAFPAVMPESGRFGVTQRGPTKVVEIQSDGGQRSDRNCIRIDVAGDGTGGDESSLFPEDGQAKFGSFFKHAVQGKRLKNALFFSSTETIVDDLEDRYPHVRRDNAESLRFLIGAGLVIKEDVESAVRGIVDDAILPGLRARDPLRGDNHLLVRGDNAKALKSLIDAGLIIKEDVRSTVKETVNDVILPGLRARDPFSRLDNARALASLTEAGLIIKEDVRRTVSAILLDIVRPGLSAEDLVARRANAEVLRLLIDSGIVIKDEMRQGAAVAEAVDTIISDLAEDYCWLARQANAQALQSLVRSGLVSRERVRKKIEERGIAGIFLAGLTGQAQFRPANVGVFRETTTEALISLIDAGFVTGEEATAKQIVKTVFDGLGDSDSGPAVRLAKLNALKSLVSAGFISKEEEREEIKRQGVKELTLAELSDEVFRYDHWIFSEILGFLIGLDLISKEEGREIFASEISGLMTDSLKTSGLRRGHAAILKSLIDAGFITKAEVRVYPGEIEAMFREVYGQAPSGGGYSYCYLLLVNALKDSESAAYSVFRYLSRDLLRLFEWYRYLGKTDYFTELLADMIKAGKTPGESAILLDREFKKQLRISGALESRKIPVLSYSQSQGFPAFLRSMGDEAAGREFAELAGGAVRERLTPMGRTARFRIEGKDKVFHFKISKGNDIGELIREAALLRAVDEGVIQAGSVDKTALPEIIGDNNQSLFRVSGMPSHEATLEGIAYYSPEEYFTYVTEDVSRYFQRHKEWLAQIYKALSGTLDFALALWRQGIFPDEDIYHRENKFLWLEHLDSPGSIRLSMIREWLRYPNISILGPRDFGHYRLLSEMKNAGDAVNTIGNYLIYYTFIASAAFYNNHRRKSEFRAFIGGQYKKMGVNIYPGFADEMWQLVQNVPVRDRALGTRGLLLKPQAWDAIFESSVNVFMSLVSEAHENDGGVPAAESDGGKKGGIDFRVLPVVVDKRIGAIPPALSAAEMSRLVALDLDAEWNKIMRMLEGKMIPSSRNIEECVLSSYVKQRLERDRDRSLNYIAAVLRLEEEQVLEADDVLLDLLALLESGGPGTGLQQRSAPRMKERDEG